MSKILAFVRSEPVYIQAGAQAALGLALAFGLHLSAGQVGAILAATAAALAIATRQIVSPVPPKE